MQVLAPEIEIYVLIAKYIRTGLEEKGDREVITPQLSEDVSFPIVTKIFKNRAEIYNAKERAA